jgi:H+-translocating NAD(P) transhydrogenase subunit alpha
MELGMGGSPQKNVAEAYLESRWDRRQTGVGVQRQRTRRKAESHARAGVPGPRSSTKERMLTLPLCGVVLITLQTGFGRTGVSGLDLWAMAFVFMLSTFIGFDVIRNVSRLLHTPLMSLTNAISAIAVVGSIIIAGEQKTTFSTVLGTIAVAASMTNIVSGFLITDRMLRMFKRKEPAK